jgi:hypothetical protein
MILKRTYYEDPAQEGRELTYSCKIPVLGIETLHPIKWKHNSRRLADCLYQVFVRFIVSVAPGLQQSPAVGATLLLLPVERLC